MGLNRVSLRCWHLCRLLSSLLPDKPTSRVSPAASSHSVRDGDRMLDLPMLNLGSAFAVTIRKSPLSPRLSGKKCESSRLSQLRRRDSEQEAKKDSRYINEIAPAAKFSCHTYRDGLKAPISLVYGHVPDAILKVERERCPGAVSQIAFGRFGNSPGRPRRRSARSWLPGERIGCPLP